MSHTALPSTFLATIATQANPGFVARAVWLVDLENVVGDPYAPADDIAAVWQTLVRAIPSTPDDLMIVGSGSGFAREAWFVLPSRIRRVVRDGKNGGERALIEAVDVDQIACRFGRLVVASGDHEFVELAMEARVRGMHVHQVTGRGRPAHSLLNAACSRSRLRLGQPGLRSWRAAIGA